MITYFVSIAVTLGLTWVVIKIVFSGWKRKKQQQNAEGVEKETENFVTLFLGNQKLNNNDLAVNKPPTLVPDSIAVDFHVSNSEAIPGIDDATTIDQSTKPREEAKPKQSQPPISLDEKAPVNPPEKADIKQSEPPRPIKYIGYTPVLVPSTSAYPLVRMPKAGRPVPVKFPRAGRTGRRGFCERRFLTAYLATFPKLVR